jgi:hypothetical protein
MGLLSVVPAFFVTEFSSESESAKINSIGALEYFPVHREYSMIDVESTRLSYCELSDS